MRYFTVLATTVAYILTAPTALAQTATWNGTNADWTTPNWFIGGVLTRIPNGGDVTAIIGGGAVYLDTGSSFEVGHASLSGLGILGGNGLLTVFDAFVQSNGSMGATLNLIGQGNEWTGGSWLTLINAHTTIGANGALLINIPDVMGIPDVANLQRRTLTNNGLITHRFGYIFGNGPIVNSGIAATAIINNGTWIEQTAVGMEFIAGVTQSWAFTNNGTFTKIGSGPTSFNSVRFDNAGLVDVQQGTLRLNSGTSSPSGVFHAELGTAITLGDSIAYTINGSTFTGDGQFSSSGTLTMSGTITASNLTLNGAAMSGSYTLSGPDFLWTGADINSFGGNSGTTIAADAVLEIYVTGNTSLSRRTLENNGTITHSGGSISGNGAIVNSGIAATAIINNGTWIESADVPLEFVGSRWTFTNNGTFTKRGSQSTTFSNARFDNTGAIDVQGGTLIILANFTQTEGEMMLSGGGVAGALTFTGGSLKGSGDLAGNVTMTGATLEPGLSSGLLSFGANLVLNSASVPLQLEGTSRGSTYDAIDVAGSLSLGGSTLQLDVAALDPATPIGTEFLIFNKTSAPAISGTFASLGQGTRFNSGIFEFEITYLGGDGNDIVLTVTDSSFCYADCDPNGVLDLFDFLCFQNSFVLGEPYACDCDTSTGPLVCDLFDFLCFQDAFVRGCP